MITISYKEPDSESPTQKNILTESIDEKFTLKVDTIKGRIVLHNSKEGFSLEHNSRVIFDYNKLQLELFKTKK